MSGAMSSGGALYVSGPWRRVGATIEPADKAGITDVVLGNAAALQGETSGGAALDLIQMSGGDQVIAGNASSQFEINASNAINFTFSGANVASIISGQFRVNSSSLAFLGNDAKTFGKTTAHSTGGGTGLTIVGQDAAAASGGDGGEVAVEPGTLDGAGSDLGFVVRTKAGAESFRSTARGVRFPFASAYRIETLTADRTITYSDAQWLRFDPSGGTPANRDVTLPAVEAGAWFHITNEPGSGFNLVVKNPAAAILVTLTEGESCFAVCNSTAWAIFGHAAAG